MTELQIEEIRNETEKHEGRKPFMYLDIKGLVTVGIGHMLPNADAAFALPFEPHGPVREEFFRLETLARISSKEQLEHRRAEYYSALTTCRLANAAINQLFEKTLLGFVRDLEKRFPAFESWPWPAQKAEIDMIYSLGPARLAGYLLMNAALDRRDFAAAAMECFRHGWNDSPEHPGERNRYTRDLFLQAATMG
jgi:GH24 family phage-related lysozyme (muramidase)